MTSLFFYKRQTNAETLVGFRGLIFRASAQSLENQVKNNSFSLVLQCTGIRYLKRTVVLILVLSKELGGSSRTLR